MQWWFTSIKTLSLARECKHTIFSMKSWPVSVAGPGRSVSNDIRLKGKHFSVSKHPMRKSYAACAYQKKADGKQKKTKTSNFCEKCSVCLQKISCPVPYQK